LNDSSSDEKEANNKRKFEVEAGANNNMKKNTNDENDQNVKSKLTLIIAKY